eukprot:403365563
MSTLAAARADNFYYPKDWDPSKGNLTAFHNSKKKGINGVPVKKRDKKMEPPPKIRFEMMFNVRCLGCKNSIGKGVRFNAQKRTIGQYLSTKIYEFSMNCHLCSNRLIIKTDPKACDYVIVSGLEKRPEDLKEGSIENNQNPTGLEITDLTLKSQIEAPSTNVVIEERNHRKLIENNAFYKLETANEDRLKFDAELPRLQRILDIKAGEKNDFDLNALLRKRMRERKNDLIQQEIEASKPKNFALPLVQELEQEDLSKIDKVRSYQSQMNYQKHKIQSREEIKHQSIFGNRSNSLKPIQNLPIDVKVKMQKMAIQNQSQNNKIQESKKSKIMKHLERVNK